jgi:hypothetical protein
MGGIRSNTVQQICVLHFGTVYKQLRLGLPMSEQEFPHMLTYTYEGARQQMKSFYVSDASDFLLSQCVVFTVPFELHTCQYQLLE